jgi:ABC-2 type transport system permease protein
MFVSLVGFLMPALVFGGFMFPIENMPEILQWVSYIVPTRWFFDIVKNIMVKGLGISYIVQEIVILCVMTLVFLVIALKKFKIRLE